jgi:3,8-divinyl chlorophyllide a/chlorophyllide a reductase subunit X
MELGGPEVGRGCGGRGIIHGFELLEKLGFHDWDFDYVLLDFLGDVVCGGFGLPIARDMCQKVIVVGSNDLQSLYVANNVCSAVEYFRKLGGNVGVAGMVINKDDGTGEAQAFAEAVGHPGARRDPAMTTSAARAPTTRSSAPRRRVGRALFEELADNVAEAPPAAPQPADAGRPAGPVQRQGHRRDVVLNPRPWPTCAASDVLKQALARSGLRRWLRAWKISPQPHPPPVAGAAGLPEGACRIAPESIGGCHGRPRPC